MKMEQEGQDADSLKDWPRDETMWTKMTHQRFDALEIGVTKVQTKRGMRSRTKSPKTDRSNTGKMNMMSLQMTKKKRRMWTRDGRCCG